MNIEPWVLIAIIVSALVIIAATITASRIAKLRKINKYERGLKMTSLLIHLPPTTDDIEAGGRDKRDIMNEAISKAQVMYSILASSTTKGVNRKLYGEPHYSLEIIASGGFIKYYAVVPQALKETARQAIQSAYPTSRIEEHLEDNIFKYNSNVATVSGAELTLNKDYYLPIATYEDTKRDASMGILNALSNLNKDEGAAVQILFRPADKNWSDGPKSYIEDLQKGKIGRAHV